MQSEKTIKQTVVLAASLCTEIQALYVARFGSSRGAIQDVLAKGAQLELDRLKGDPPSDRTAEPLLPPKSARYVGKLVHILGNGDKEGISVVTQLIDIITARRPELGERGRGKPS